MFDRRIVGLMVVLGTAIGFLAGCSDDDSASPTSNSRDVVEQPVTTAAARATTQTALWALSDIASLASHWTGTDLLGVPTRLEGTLESDPAVFDPTNGSWRIPLASTLELGPELYAVHGEARVTFLNGDAPVANGSAATRMRAEVRLDVSPRILEKSLQRDLDLTTSVSLVVEDIGAMPHTISGSAFTVGAYSLVDDVSDHRALIELAWSFALTESYRDCCPSGTIELSVDRFRTHVEMHGLPRVQTRLVVDEAWMDDIAVELPCVEVQAAGGTRLRSRGPVMEPATSQSIALLSRARGWPQEGDAALPISGRLELRGRIGGVPFDPVSADLTLETSFADALTAIEDDVRERLLWNVGLELDAEGRFRVDNQQQAHIPAATRWLRIWGNLSSNSDARGTHLRQGGEFLATATAGDDLRFLHSDFTGEDVQLNTGDVVSLRGEVGGAPIVSTVFNIGDPLDGKDGTTLSELFSWMEEELDERALAAAGAGGITVTLEADGSTIVHNPAGNPLLENIQLEVGGHVSFNQAMGFGSRIPSGTSAGSSAAFLSPAAVSDPLSELFNSSGARLNFVFAHDGFGSYWTNIQIGGTLGGEAITPRIFTISRDVTTLDDLLRQISQAFSISNTTDVSLTSGGKIDIQGDLGIANAIDHVSLREEGNVFSNLGSSSNFGLIDPARDARTFSVANTVYDHVGGAHRLTFAFTKRSGSNVWDWQARMDATDTIVAGESGTVVFDANGRLLSALQTDSNDRFVFAPGGGSLANGVEVSIRLDFGTPGGVDGLTQYAPIEELFSLADGRSYLQLTSATEIELVLVSFDGSSEIRRTLHTVPSIDGGAIEVSEARAVAPGRYATPFELAVTSVGTTLVPSAGSAATTLEVFAEMSDRETTIEAPVVGGTTSLGTVLEAIAHCLQVSPTHVRLGIDGAIEVEAPAGHPAVLALGIREKGAQNPVLEATLGFDVTAQASAGCR